MNTEITLVGNLVDDPILRFTSTGRSVANFRVASTPRYPDRATGEWKDGATLFLTCNVWGTQGEHCAESLLRGTEVIVRGRLKQRSYETREGERRTVYEIEADVVGPTLRRATATITKIQRTTAPAPGSHGAPTGPDGSFGQPSPADTGAPADPWASPASPGSPAGPWNPAHAPVPAGTATNTGYANNGVKPPF
ncbi:single-stranded DNA-binding protein [Actinomadura atramentaria]|uniref:single-stranded DNA-binding protein n=1 Tax=Actinomadura atramentaria TaxID=1990 RepID=UPI000372B1C4|nr:single-stranded DNA-binding protein [Actinomadura atramentaria]